MKEMGLNVCTDEWVWNCGWIERDKWMVYVNAFLLVSKHAFLLVCVDIEIEIKCLYSTTLDQRASYNYVCNCMHVYIGLSK